MNPVQNYKSYTTKMENLNQRENKLEVQKIPRKQVLVDEWYLCFGRQNLLMIFLPEMPKNVLFYRLLHQRIIQMYFVKL